MKNIKYIITMVLIGFLGVQFIMWLVSIGGLATLPSETNDISIFQWLLQGGIIWIGLAILLLLRIIKK